MALSLDKYTANTAAAAFHHEASAGLKNAIEAEAAPLGVGVQTKAIEAEGLYTQAWNNGDPAEVVTGSKNSGWGLSFTVAQEISTSEDPAFAGRASDLILGGGLELRFTEVLKVAQKSNHDKTGICLEGTDAHVWEPSKVTTFLLSVQKVADEMRRIKANLVKLETNATTEVEVANYLQQKYDDWQFILDTYEGSSNEAEINLAKNTFAVDLANLLRFEDKEKSADTVTSKNWGKDGDSSDEESYKALQSEYNSRGGSTAAGWVAQLGLSAAATASLAVAGNPIGAAAAGFLSLKLAAAKGVYQALMEEPEHKLLKKVKKDHDDLTQLCHGHGRTSTMHIDQCNSLLDHPWKTIGCLMSNCTGYNAAKVVSEGVPGTEKVETTMNEFDALQVPTMTITAPHPSRDCLMPLLSPRPTAKTQHTLLLLAVVKCSHSHTLSSRVVVTL
jgi:hypothetical protein